MNKYLKAFVWFALGVNLITAGLSKNIHSIFGWVCALAIWIKLVTEEG